MPNIQWKDSKVKRVHTMDEVKKLLKADGPLMIVIYADWCGHCQAAEPEWTKLANSADVYAIESEEYSGDDVNGYPTMKIVKKGKSKAYEGGRSAEEMKSALLGAAGGKRSRRSRTLRFRSRRRKTHRALR